MVDAETIIFRNLMQTVVAKVVCDFAAFTLRLRCNRLPFLLKTPSVFNESATRFHRNLNIDGVFQFFIRKSWLKTPGFHIFYIQKHVAFKNSYYLCTRKVDYTRYKGFEEYRH